MFRWWPIFRKSVREQIREPWGLALTLTTAPFFVFLYWLFFAGSSSYALAIENLDQPIQTETGDTFFAGKQLIESLTALQSPDKRPLLRVLTAPDRKTAMERLEQRQISALLLLPKNFSASLLSFQKTRQETKAKVSILGDFTHPYYAATAVIAQSALEKLVQALSDSKSPLQIEKRAIRSSDKRTEFENYVPGLLILSVIMLIFSASMTVTYEVETATLHRLQLTKMRAFDLLFGISLSQVLLGTLALILTFLVALFLGFRSQGPLLAAIVVGSLTSLSIVGIGMIVASFARTVTEAFLFCNFPMFLLIFFSGSLRPVPSVPLFTLGSRTVGLYDLLQPSHAVVALHKILTFGASLGDVAFELGAVFVLALLYFGAGLWLFQRRRLRPQA